MTVNLARGHIPRVSVIIPAYNAAATVGTAVDSVLAQTSTDFELIVVDDGSTDATGEIVKSRDDARVRYVRTENRGVSAARNRGLELASGELVSFLDADDAWRPEKLELQQRALANASMGLAFASAMIVDDQLRATGLDSALHCADYSQELLLTGNVLSGSCSSVMVRHSLIGEVGGFDPQLSQCADWDMWLRLSLVTQFAPVAEPLVLYRQVPGTMSSDPALLERDTFALLDKFFATPVSAPYLRLRRRAYANHWMVCAGTYLHDGRLKASLRCVANGIRSDPRTLDRPLTLPARRIARARRGQKGHHAGLSRSTKA